MLILTHGPESRSTFLASGKQMKRLELDGHQSHDAFWERVVARFFYTKKVVEEIGFTKVIDGISVADVTSIQRSGAELKNFTLIRLNSSR